MTTFLEAGQGAPERAVSELLLRAEPLHRQLRPHIPGDYSVYLRKMFGEGASLAALDVDGRLRALAVWRAYHATYAGLRFYVDDLVTDETERGRGWGGMMLEFMEEKARAMRCDSFALDSGVQRQLAHRFYFRAGMTITAFAFVKKLSDRFG